jgi:lipopolysaccharide transport system permease protein
VPVGVADEKAVVKSAPNLVVLKPRKGWLGIDLKELWQYRELIYFLTWRDIKVRYKQAVLGIAWAILQPVLTTAITSLVFGLLLKVQSDGLPYPVFVLSALLPWHLFQLSLQKSSISLVGNANLITKIYFPRIIIPISSVLAVMVDFLISLVLLFIAMAIYGITLKWTVLWVIPLTLLAVFAALAVGLWLSALNVQYRDVQQMVPFLLQIWMYATPIVYPITTIPEGTLRYLYSLNPMVGVVQGFRWALFGGSPPDMTLLVSTVAVLLLLVGGLFYFKRMEKTFADVV